MAVILSCFLFCLAFYGSPGPATLSVASSGKSKGMRGSIPYVTGIVAGIAVNLVVTISGLMVLLSANEAFAVVFKYVGFTYILYLGWRIARSPVGPEFDQELPYTFKSGILLNSLNPKAYMAAAAVYTQFESRLALPVLVAMILGTTIVVDIGWCLLGSTIRKLRPSSKASRWINRAFGIALVMVAVVSFFL